MEVIDLNKLLIANPISTFYLRVSGNSMIDAGIHDNDIVIVDKSVQAKDGDIVIASVRGQFTIKEICFSPLTLIPHNKEFEAILINESDCFEIFGVVTGLIRKLSRGGRQAPNHLK